MQEREAGTRERTGNYRLIQQWCRTPEQRLYEGVRPVVIFGKTTSERFQMAYHSLQRHLSYLDEML